MEKSIALVFRERFSPHQNKCLFCTRTETFSSTSTPFSLWSWLVAVISEEASVSLQVAVMMMSQMTSRMHAVTPVTLSCYTGLLFLSFRATNSCILRQVHRRIVVLIFIKAVVGCSRYTRLRCRREHGCDDGQVRDSFWLVSV